MKRLLGLAIASLLLSPSAALAEWVNVSAATNGNHFDVETSSISYSGNLATYRTRMRLSYPDKNGAAVVGSVEIMNCNSGAYQDLAMVVLSAEGRVISNDEPGFNAPIEQTKVGSVQHRIYNFVCPSQNVANSVEEENIRGYWENSRDSARSIAEMARVKWW